MLSEKMLLDRAGNFTASENHRLMAGWNDPAPNVDFDGFLEIHEAMKDMDKKPLVGELKNLVDASVSGEKINRAWSYIQYQKPSKGLITYAEEKAIEELFYPDPSLEFSTAHTRNGEEREVECMEILADRTGLNFVNTGEEQVHIHADEIGCTPDGIVLDDLDLIETGAEVKCKSPHKHAILMHVNDNQSLKDLAFDHYVQVQTQMLVTGATVWYFACFNPFAKSESFSFKSTVIKRDIAFINILKQRIDLAKKIKNEFLLKLDREASSDQQLKKAA